MNDVSTLPKTLLATFGGGCFWCLDAVFRRVRGVHSVTSGYMGGHVSSPTYRMVCQGDTGHAEVIRISYDPSVITYQQLLDVFFRIHDPTTLNRQEGDVGTQYRSVIFVHDLNQEKTARSTIKDLSDSSALSGRSIVTEVLPAAEFYPAENYHQNYYANNPAQPYCAMVIDPKVQKFLQSFPMLTSGPI
jgi:peptide-methionine (S)-S-oxide reductase